MNSLKKITLMFALSILTPMINAAQKPTKELLKDHTEKATNHWNWAAYTGSSLFSIGSFEMLYRDLDKTGHVPPQWILWRKLNKPMLAVAAIGFVGTSTAYAYNACLREHYKEESKKWFWQK